MSDEKDSKNELLEIFPVQFKYKKEEIGPERSWGTRIENNPNYKKFKDEFNNPREQRNSKCYKNTDYYISGLEDLLKNPTIENSLKIWNTLSSTSYNAIYAVYIPNNDFNKKYGKYDKEFDSYNNPCSVFESRIAHLLKKYKWIPDNEEIFHEPSEITYRQIHDDFNCENWYWLDALGVINEKTAKFRKEKEIEQKLEQKKKAAEIFGFTLEEVELFAVYKKILENRIGKFVDIFNIKNT